MEEQQKMEAYMDQTIREIAKDQAGLLNDMMQARWTQCSFAEKSIVMEFPVLPWQANRVGLMHGGAMATAVDLSMAALARFVSGSNFTPTISIEIKFIKPVQVGDVLEIKTKATAAGRTITHFASEALSKESGKLVATASSVYYNLDITKR